MTPIIREDEFFNGAQVLYCRKHKLHVAVSEEFPTCPVCKKELEKELHTDGKLEAEGAQ